MVNNFLLCLVEGELTMPELRYIDTYEYDDDLSPEDRIPANAIITRSSYDVSDEELAEERKARRRENLLDELDEIKDTLELIKEKLGI